MLRSDLSKATFIPSPPAPVLKLACPVRSDLSFQAMKIIQHPESFEVVSADGTIVKRFPFDDNASRRAISGQMTRKQAFIAAKTFAGKGHTVVPQGS